MKLATNDPELYYPVKLPCIVFSQEEADAFLRNFMVSNDPERARLYAKAVALVQELIPLPEEILIYNPRGEVISSIIPGYTFISSEARSA